MYIPKIYAETDREWILAFIRKYSFGIIVSIDDATLVATHLPFVIKQEGGNFQLFSHFSKANPQWYSIENKKVLIIFHEPHAYISPVNYEKLQNVPTWNYIAVHLYGIVRVITNEDEVINTLENSIDTYEPGYRKQWNEFPLAYKSKMINGITAFEITITDVQAVKKLSQNKTENEKKNIIDQLCKSSHGTENELGKYMEAEVTQKQE